MCREQGSQAVTRSLSRVICSRRELLRSASIGSRTPLRRWPEARRIVGVVLSARAVVCRPLRAVEPAARVGQLRRRRLRCARQSRASRSVFHPARLETRTEESNMCASHSVLHRLEGRNESEFGDLAQASCPSAQPSPARASFSEAVPRPSAYVGTRKMVNYA